MDETLDRNMLTMILVIVLLIAGGLVYIGFIDNEGASREFEEFVAPRPAPVSIDSTHQTVWSTECETDINYDIYQLQERYFNEEDTLPFKIALHYIPNSDSATLNFNFFKKRVNQMGEFYLNSNAKLDFKLSQFNVILGKPQDKEAYLERIINLEKVLGRKREDMRNYYYIGHLDFIHNFYGKEGYINLYIFNDTQSSIPGIAGGIESTYAAVKTAYLDPRLLTPEHEMGHCLGLWHTHSYSNSDNPYNRETGDRICDTHDTFPFTGLVNKNCKLIKDYKEVRKMIEQQENYASNPISVMNNATDSDINTIIRNTMSYTRHQCRVEFTPEQIRRMRKIIETNSDLRACIEGLKTDYKQNIISNLKEY